MKAYLFYNKISCLVIFLLLSFSSRGQENGTRSFSKQLSVLTDNDYYLLQGKDGYYTNGLILNYSRIHASKKPAIIKQVNQYEAGQKLYTPFSRKITTTSEIDRPITGYLYGKFSQSDFLKNNQLFQWSISVGTIGKAALGEQMQNTFHKLINVNSSYWGWIWDYQLKSEPGINLEGRYAKGLMPDETSGIQITPVSQVTLGTTFTNFKQGILLQLGKLNAFHESAFWNASVQEKNVSKTNKLEIFFYYYPRLMYQLYDATIQGGLFRKDKGPFTSRLKPLVFTQQLGGVFTFERYILRLDITFESKEAASQHLNHAYGGIQVSYRFN